LKYLLELVAERKRGRGAKLGRSSSSVHFDTICAVATKSAFACRAVARVFHAKADVSFQRSKRKNPLACELVGGKQANGFERDTEVSHTNAA